MGSKKINLTKPSKSSAKLNYKVRFVLKDNGYFVVTNKKRKIMNNKTFNNHNSALEYAVELSNGK